MEQNAPLYNHPLHNTNTSQFKTTAKPPKRAYLYLYVIGEQQNRSKKQAGPVSVVKAMQNVVNRPVKIGFSRNPWARTTDLQKSISEDMTLLACIGVPQDCPTQLPANLKKAGNKKGWYFMDDNIKSLINQINNKTFTGFYGWPDPQKSQNPHCQTTETAITPDQQSEKNIYNKTPSEAITTKREQTNNLNNNKGVSNEIQPEQEQPPLIPMTLDWQPGPDFDILMTNFGVKTPHPSVIVEFILYWLDQVNEKRTQNHWQRTLLKQIRYIEQKEAREAAYEGALIAARIETENPGYTGQQYKENGHTSREKRHQRARTVQSKQNAWSQAFKEFEKTETVVITEDGKRQNKAAHATHMAAAMASLGKRKWQNE